MEMDREELMQLILDHYENPRHYGPCDDADVVQKGGNPGCGDIITLYLKLHEEDSIEDISFEGEGCILSQAATSMVTEIVKGKTVEEVEKMNSDVITDVIGRDLAMTRPRCTTLGITTVKMALKEWRNQKTLDRIEEEKELAKNQQV
jgi:nitrogen fixation protein NifU and related proteins